MSWPWRGSSSSSQSWDEDQRSVCHWQPEQLESPAKKDQQSQQADRFKSVTTLGSKHALPLEDRKALLIAVLHELSPQKNVVSKIAVANWAAVTTHAVLYLLSRATPKTSMRILRDNDTAAFTIEYAAKTLAEAAFTVWGNQEALADPRWVHGAAGFRFDSDLAQLWIVCGSDVVWVGYSLGPGSTVDPEQGAFDEIFTVAQNTC